MVSKSRRDVLRYSAAGVVTAATAAVGVQGLTAADSAAGPQRSAAGAARDFDEVYKGKKITGKHDASGRHELRIINKKLALSSIDTLFVPEDGSAPRRGVGYLSAVNHYDPVEIDDSHQDGLRNLARKIVDILGDAELSAEAALEHHH